MDLKSKCKMNKGNRFYYILLVLYLNCFIIYAQKATIIKDKITTAISGYFLLDRENIHLNFNKKIFLTHEEIWFKGYVFNRKSNTPFFTTTNVFTILFDENGNKINEQLLHSKNGSFSGSFKLNENLKSGKYYVQVYTNWMNNFTEDESSTYTVTVINEKETTIKQAKTPNHSKINIELQPEGGNYIKGINNNVGIKISDCNGNPLPIGEGEIQDSKGNLIKQVQINKFGYGVISLVPTDEIFKSVFKINNKDYQAFLPKAIEKGIVLEVNNHTFPDKIMISVKTNTKTIDSIAKKPFYLIIQQDDKASIVDVNFNNQKLEHTLVFSNENLSNGINTIRLIDDNLNQIAERTVFKNQINSSYLVFNVTKKNTELITLSAKTTCKNANLSLSVLPENSIATDDQNDILGDFLLKPYLNESVTNTKYFLKEPSRLKKYELDLVLLNQKSSKYTWKNILSNPPTEKHEFETGLNMKGVINQALGNPKSYSVKILSLTPEIYEHSDVNEKNEFYFKNMIVTDSALVNFNLLKKTELVPGKIKLYATITNGKRKFNKLFNPKLGECEHINEENTITNINIPKLKKEVIQLNTIAIEKTSKKLKFDKSNGNTLLKGYKITDSDKNTDVLYYIERNGFNVDYSPLGVKIQGRLITTILGVQPEPLIYIDNMLLMNFDELWGMKMSELEEIYLNPRANVPAFKNNTGIIKLYRKKMTYKQKQDVNTLVISGGFKKTMPFVTPEYLTTSDSGFQNFGTINWISTVLTSESGAFQFQIPNLSQNKIKISIEGFTDNGQFISETKTISLE